MSERKKVVIFLGFRNDVQLKRLLRFLDKHGFMVYGVKDLLEVEGISREEYEKILEARGKREIGQRKRD